MLSASYQFENGSLIKVFVPVKGSGAFTLDEDEYLIRNYQKKTTRDISEFMLRPARQIEHRLKQLNLQKYPNWKPEEIDLLCQSLDNATLALKLGRSINAIKIMKTRLGLCKQNQPPSTRANCFTASQRTIKSTVQFPAPAASPGKKQPVFHTQPG